MSKIKVNLAIIIIVLLSAVTDGVRAEESSEVISYTKMYADDSGETHFSDETIELEYRPDIENIKISPFTQAASVGFLRASPILDMDWHPAPRRQWIFILSGTVEVEVQDGEIRQFPGGSILFVEDTSGKGHKTRVVGGKPLLAAWVPVVPE